MIYEEIKKLQNLIKSSTGLNCLIGNATAGAKDLPIFIISIEGSDEAEKLGSCAFDVGFFFTVRLIGGAEESQIAKILKAYEDFMTSVRFDFAGAIPEAPSKAYEGSQLIITWLFKLKEIYQKGE